MPWTGRDLSFFDKPPGDPVGATEVEEVSDGGTDVQSRIAVSIRAGFLLGEDIFPIVCRKGTDVFPLGVTNAVLMMYCDPAVLTHGDRRALIVPPEPRNDIGGFRSVASLGIDIVIRQSKIEGVLVWDELCREEARAMLRIVKASKALHPILIPSTCDVRDWVVLRGEFADPEHSSADLVMPSVGQIPPRGRRFFDDLSHGRAMEGIVAGNEAEASRIEKLIVMKGQPLRSGQHKSPVFGGRR